MLLFWSEGHVEEWCNGWNLPRSEVIPLDKCFSLAQAWYSPDRREPEWRRRTIDEAEALFGELGFISEFWRLPR
ncbi:MAG: hypothetical protein LC776_09885 [Acidobacteria bacterium]|nr:hypothetical protein [Acidobacteriota bacterium]